MTPYHLTLYRHHERADATWGILYGGGYDWYTMELPWRDNAANESCIPPDRYAVLWNRSPKFDTDLYVVVGTEPRRGIRFHTAYTPDQLEGCISLGAVPHRSGKLLESHDAMREFQAIMSPDPWILEIVTTRPPDAPNRQVGLLDALCDRYGGRRLDTVGPTA